MQLDGQVIVLGAGVGGLAVARALALRGHAVTILEQAPEITEVGAGLQISPNGATVLRALGLGPQLERLGMAARAVQLRDGLSGAGVMRLDLAGLRPDATYRFLHRADLIAMLAEGAREAGVEIRLLQHIDKVVLGAHPPRLITAQGAEYEPQLVVGADGIHSRLRAALNGPAKPFFTHHAAWRAIIPHDPARQGPIAPVAQVFMGPGRHLVSYPLRGGRLRNLVAVEERRGWVAESWSLRDSADHLRAAFASFTPEVRGWLEQVEDPALWGLFRHPVAGCWQATGPEQGAWSEGRGRSGRAESLGWGAALLGDAAHPTLPFLAQGAVMALEDAWVLAREIARAETLPQALSAYQQARAGRSARIVEAANRNARAYHLGGLPRRVAHLGLRAIAAVKPSLMLDRLDWLYGHDVTQG